MTRLRPMPMILPRPNHHHIPRPQTAQIAMYGVGGRQKVRRRAGAGQGRADLARNVPRLTDAAGHNRG